MDNSLLMLLWGGISFLVIGLWMLKKDREQIRVIESRLVDKENNLYELYQSLEEIIDDMVISYREHTAEEKVSRAQALKLGEEKPAPSAMEGNNDLEDGGDASVYDDSILQYQWEVPPELEEEIGNQLGREPEIQHKKFPHGQLEKQGDNKYRKVIELKNRGYTEENIAKELGIGKGEVRLIIGFNRGQG